MSSVELTIDESKKHRDPNLSIRDLFFDNPDENHKDRLKFDTIFQRNSVWTDKQNQELIISILTDRPLPTIHLNESKAQDYHIIDGKQRLTAIKKFIIGLYPVNFEDEKGSPISFTYKDLQRAEKGDYKSIIKSRFHAYKLPICMWEFPDFSKVEALFSIYNNGTALRQWEKVYCVNYLTRALIKYIHQNYLYKIDLFWKQTALNDDRFNCTALIHKCLIAMLGIDLTGMSDFDISREINQTVIEESCSKLNAKMREFYKQNQKDLSSLDEDSLVTKELIKHLKLDSALESVRNVADCFQWIVDEKDVWKGEINSLDFMHVSSFLYQQLKVKTISMAILRDNKSALVSFYNDFCIWKNKEESLKRRSGSKRNSFRNKLKKLFDALNLPSPNPISTISQSKKDLAIAMSDGIDPISGDKITATNKVVDHKHAKSMSSETEFALLTKDTNSKKSNLDVAQAEKIISYIKSDNQHHD